MILVTLHNPSESDVFEFPVAEPLLVNGEVEYDSVGSIKSTGKTLLWTIEAGEEKAFPEYVAKELLKVYEFLKVTGEEKKVEKAVDGNACKECGQVFTGKRGLALHIASKHPEKLQ